MGHVRVHNAEKSLSFCYLTKQRLINGLEDGVNERHGRHDDASPGYRPKFHVFTEKGSTETGVLNMPSWKAKKLRKLRQEKVLLELGVICTNPRTGASEETARPRREDNHSVNV